MAKKRIRTNGMIICLAVVLIAVRPLWFLRIGISKFEIGLAFWGMALVMFGLLLRVASRGYKSENSGNGHALVAGGPYTLVRNPMYLGILLIGLGVILVSFQWWVLCVFLGFFAARYYTLIAKEEKLLSESFGDLYREYMKKTPRLFPRLCAWCTKNAAEYIPLRWKWLRREMSSLVIVPAAIIILEMVKTLVLARQPLSVSEFAGFGLVLCVFILFSIRLEKNYARLAK